jgi:CRISPR-associated protein Csh2
MENKPYNKFAQGLLIVRAKNSSFNSDFSGLPRRLPDDYGTIYATDKALKYCVRKYLHDKGEKVFVWRRKDPKTGLPFNIDKNYIYFFKEIPKKKIKMNKKEEEIVDKNEMLMNILSLIDSRLFGFTYAGETNISVTGPIQLSYGINKMNENQFYTNQILSPYQDVKKEEAQQQTLGSETKTLEAHYVYDFVINPNNLISTLEFIPEEKSKLLLQESDITLFKEAMCRGVSSVTSSSKIGSDSELFMFVEMNANKKDGKVESHILPLMKDHVKINNNDGKTTIDLESVFTSLNTSYKKYISSIELYYDNNETKISGIDKFPVKKRHIVTLEEIT